MSLEKARELFRQAFAEMRGSVAANASTLVETFRAMNMAMLDQYRAAVAATPGTADQMAKDILAATASMVGAFARLPEDENIKAQLARILDIVARSRAETVSAYEKAGFSRDEAFALLLADMGTGVGSITTSALISHD
jgi:thioredoxin-like negative regulator of GroEL